VSQNQNGGKGRKARSEIDLKKLDCASCVPRIEKRLKEIEGVESAKVNYLLNRLYVTFDLELTNESIIEATVEKLVTSYAIRDT